MSTTESFLARQNERPGPWLALLAFILALQVSPWWFPTPDSVLYLSVARSLAEGEGLRALGGTRLGHPPGYALLISPAFLLEERPFLAISILHWILAVALMLGVYRWARSLVPEGALLLTGLVMVNVSLWIHFRRTLSELAFTTAAVWAAIALQRILDAPNASATIRRCVPGLVLLLVAISIREAGAFLAAGFVLAAILGGSRPEARRVAIPAAGLLALLALVAVAAFTAREQLSSSGVLGTHLDGVLDPGRSPATRIAEGARLRVSEVGRILVPGMFKAYGERWLDWNTAVYLPLFLLLAAGWWRLVRRRVDPFVLALPFHFGAYVFWAYDAGTRYLLPVLPVLWACVWALVEPLRNRRLSFLAIVLVAHLAVSIGYVATREIPRALACDRDWPAVLRFVEALRDSSRPVLLRNVPQCTELMLVFALDRPLRQGTLGARLEPDVEWLVTPTGEPSPPGFETHARIPGYELRRRTPERAADGRSAVAS